MKKTTTNGTIFVEQLMTIDYRAHPIKFLEKVPIAILENILQTIHELTKLT